MDGGRRTKSFQCLLFGHTADIANASLVVILGSLFLAKKKYRSYFISVFAMSRFSSFLPTFKVYVDQIHPVVKVKSALRLFLRIFFEMQWVVVSPPLQALCRRRRTRPFSSLRFSRDGSAKRANPVQQRDELPETASRAHIELRHDGC